MSFANAQLFKEFAAEAAAEAEADANASETFTETSMRITRGATRQMLFVGSGERLNSAIHTREPVCSVEISHQADGKVSVICRDVPFTCSVEYERAASWTRSGTYTSYSSVAPNKKVNLLASQRNGNAWKLKFVGRNFYLEIRPGETLIVTHKVG